MNRKVVINTCYGGFGLSSDAFEKLLKSKYPNKTFKNAGDEYECPFEDEDGVLYSQYSTNLIERDDPILVQIVEEMGSEADGKLAQLKVVEIPDDVEWEIKDYDGIEHVAEKHRTWC